MLFGINSETLPGLQAATAGITAERIYIGAGKGVPAAWPAVTPGLVSVVSFKPDPVKVRSGELDTAILQFARSAPEHSWLVYFHEGNLPSHKLAVADYVGAVEHISGLLDDSDVPVQFGQVFGSYVIWHDHQDLKPWVVDGCDWYGLDGYQSNGTLHPADVFGPGVDAIERKVFDAQVSIIETNTLTSPADAWAEAVFDYAGEIDAPAFLWYASTLPTAGGYSQLPSAGQAQSMARRAAQEG